jgi:O-antigen/teichoic acid export membrane protein
VRAGAASLAFTGMMLVFNLVAGIVIARALGPDGRGVTAAVVMITQIAGQLAAIGAMQSLSYHAAREPARAPALYGTWVTLLLPVAVVAIAVSELLLPAVFAAQSDETLRIGRIFLANIVLVLWLQVNNGVLLGVHDFLTYDALRFLQPALSAVALVVLWLLDALTVESALLVWTGTQLLTLTVGTTRLLRRVGIARPDGALARRTLSFGVRAHGDAIAGSLNTRLDLVVLPAYVGSASVGLYSVAANVSLIVNQFATAFAALVLPSAARDPVGAHRTVVRSLQVTILLAGSVAVVLWLLATPALELVYGEDFGSAAEALRILLPGAVLYAGAAVLAAGLHGAGRPLAATISQAVGALVTFVGLLALLPGRGIDTAAAVSTGAYATVFVAVLVAYKRTVGMRWSGFLRPPAELRTEAQ